MFQGIQQKLALKYKQLEQDQHDIKNKLRHYQENLKLSGSYSPLIEDKDYNSSILVLSNTKRDHSIQILEQENYQKQLQINELKKQNNQLQNELDSLKKSVIQTHKVMEEISHQRDDLMDQLRKIKSIDLSIDLDYQRKKSISYQSVELQRKKSNSIHDPIKQYEKFVNSVRDMIIKLQPNQYKNPNIPLKDCWQWLKTIISDYVQLSNIVKGLKTILNVEQPFILLEVQQLINVILNKY
ncbi:hypothetical protein pb186bvf_006623 [Paramecium bursaria]